ncbi:hypothetical protein [Tenuifilum thalassicum]|uniref:Glycosyltransferase RgtA/B/C/D-like domain-containing protein n=1 Tax=Tenuifilum thalassicum TaxID=2590900 RepID=A0A7D3XWU9_9BACT|nr:hypothetical protein [Tenuifilum thalassicum]QKG80671.1 hypothetical protein FHG85_10460 [Tenuifilum thalassicum]
MKKNVSRIASEVIFYLKRRISTLCIVLIAVGATLLNFSHHKWMRQGSVIQWDVKSYYAYLPAALIYKDLSFQFRKDNIEKFGDLIWPIETPTGKQAIITSMGLSFLYAPFFGVVHLFSLISPQYEADGYSVPYRFALVFSALFYVIIGLLFLQRVLRRFFTEGVVAMLILAVGVGTNLLYYYTYEAPMPHAYNFSLISIFIFLIIVFYEKPNLSKSFYIGLLGGLITLIRPSNIIVLVLLLLWDVKSIKDFKDRVAFFFLRYRYTLLMILGFTIVWIPQFAYWYYVSGKIFYFTYGEAGGKFFFNNPQITNILISYKKGWFVYTPVMFLAFIGIFTLPKVLKGKFIPVFAFTLLNIFILSSWWCWWFGGSFGNRAFIDSYGIMAIPLGALITFFKRKKIFYYSLAALIVLLIGFNNFQIQQYTRQAIHYWWMNKDAYWETFLKLHPTERYWDVITLPDYEKARQGVYVEVKPERQKMKQSIVPTKQEIISYIKDNVLIYKNGENSELQSKKAEELFKKDSANYAKIIIIEKLQKSIKNNPSLLELIEKKAKKKGISLDSMVKLDAIWLYENDKY